MGHPAAELLFGVPKASADGRYYTAYPQGNAPNIANAQGAGVSVSASAASGSAQEVSEGGDGIPAPGVDSTIVWDMRAGGAQSYQNVSTNAAMIARWTSAGGGTSYNGGASGFYEPDVDGNGTHARAIQWIAGEEQEGYVGLESGSNRAPSTGWFYQTKLRLGRRPGGSGTGTEDYFVLTGGNAHHKIALLFITGLRFYIVMRPSDCKISADETGFSSDLWDENPYDYPGQIQTLTVYFQASTGTLRAWRNEKLVAEQTNLSTSLVGSRTSVLNTWQESRTMRLPAQSLVTYMWDTVVWY